MYIKMYKHKQQHSFRIHKQSTSTHTQTQTQNESTVPFIFVLFNIVDIATEISFLIKPIELNIF